MNIKPLLLSTTLIIAAQMAPMNVQAEILSIGQHPQVLKKANLPKMGQSMRMVSSKFGTAKKVSVSRGKVTKHNPKITRWDYPTFSVYFENTHVIHSVVRR